MDLDTDDLLNVTVERGKRDMQCIFSPPPDRVRDFETNKMSIRFMTIMQLCFY